MSTQVPAPSSSPGAKRVAGLFKMLAAIICVVLVADNATLKLTMDQSLHGLDWLVLIGAIVYLLSLWLARDLAAKLAVAIVMTLVLILPIELVVRVVGARRVTVDRAFEYYVWPPQSQMKFDPQDLPGVSGLSHFTINARGIRGPEFGEADAQRLLCVGGSTTECCYLDDSETWPELLRQRLTASGGKPIWVGNIGRSGRMLSDHYTALANLPEADMVDTWLVMSGINDFGHQFRGSYEKLKSRSWEHTFGYKRPPTIGRPLQRSLRTIDLISALVTRLQHMIFGGDVDRVYQDHGAAWIKERQKKRQMGQFTEVVPDYQPWLVEYEEQLMRLIELARQRGKTLVLIDQPTIWSVDISPEAEALTHMFAAPDGRYLSTARRAQVMAAFNEVMHRVAQREGVVCIGLAEVLPRSVEVFYDDCHFNENGARLVAEHLSAELVREMVVR